MQSLLIWLLSGLKVGMPLKDTARWRWFNVIGSVDALTCFYFSYFDVNTLSLSELYFNFEAKRIKKKTKEPEKEKE